MIRSTGRILTTHVGSLPRPDDLLKMVLARDRGEPYEKSSFGEVLKRSVNRIVKKQSDLGLDVIDDGEFGKPGFMHYVNQRLSGFEPMRGEVPRSPFAASRDFRSFPEYYRSLGTSAPATKAPGRG